MKLSINFRTIIIETICFLFSLLFVYAAVSKLLDFDNFQIQLGQSSLLNPFAIWISYFIPFIEIIIAIALVLPKYKYMGIFSSLGLMTIFTVYIYIVLHYSAFIPCSCGGLLEKMSWTQHLIFNCVFVALALLALVLFQSYKSNKENHYNRFLIKNILITMTLCMFSVVVLFIYSEQIMQYKNPFIRRYPQHPITLYKTMDLKFNSYYFAGYANGQIYLGNYTDPLSLLALNADLYSREIRIDFKAENLPFKMVKISVRGPYFYLMDGSLPRVFTGRTTQWKITKELKGIPDFTLAEPLDSTCIAIRSLQGENPAHVLGVFNSLENPQIKYSPNLLKKQIDGVFDTDGMLLRDDQSKKMAYVYYYRNEFILADQNAHLLYKGHTIDTISHARIKVAYLKNRSERKMSAPPMIVNQKAFLRGNLLFIQSKIPGRFEPENIWREASIIDVYDLKKRSYLMSFALYGNSRKKLSSYYITSTHLYSIMEDELQVYKLEDILKKEFCNI